MSSLAWPLLLLAIGLVLLVCEAVIPSGGLLGVLAFVAVALSLVEAFQQSFELGLRFLLADLVFSPMAIGLGLYLWPKSPLAKRMTLMRPGSDEIAVSHSEARLDHLVGQLGRSITPLRPVGLVEFDGRKVDALSEDGLIAEGSCVKAVGVRTGQLIVRTASKTNEPEPSA
jgi:membrane-bound ClpP family serine protease